MFMGRIGAKSAAFINHKPFHPGNLQNLEKVWTAEENHKRELKKQEEFLERRNQEQQIEELRRALRREEGVGQSDIAKHTFLGAAGSQGATAASARKLQRRKATISRGADQSRNTPCSGGSGGVCSLLYIENQLEAGHSAIWGSFYDRESNKWGYACCQLVKRGQLCPRRGAVDGGPAESAKRKEASSNCPPEGTLETEKPKLSDTNTHDPKRTKRERKRDATNVDSGLASILQQLQDDDVV